MKEATLSRHLRRPHYNLEARYNQNLSLKKLRLFGRESRKADVIHHPEIRHAQFDAGVTNYRREPEIMDHDMLIELALNTVTEPY